MLKYAWSFLLGWAEKHAGLGGWIGAIGAIVAIFVTWWLARSEYLRTRRFERERQAAQRREISNVITTFDPIVVSYIAAVERKDDGKSRGYNRIHMNDAEVHGARDLAFIPVTEWPSLQAYLHFKRYWFLSTQILATSCQSPIPEGDVRRMATERANELRQLLAALNTDEGAKSK